MIKESFRERASTALLAVLTFALSGISLFVGVIDLDAASVLGGRF